ncbi:uncharacterized protein SCHCODRAFT_02545613 [Schizophyllum commune H4-8]|uniref:uncharacterized protein n=1 Tax=Schizophyllum commune (strain H4-8 / FGSC 9210) TaxID=578458 RepID=UPI002160393C|nr:uncharacterized protein SCHCODRAFT_02545613 [Schizophyllum commune H4-8]KAI5891843.1 hypothetical protein SCHCODRAFT_02545613 [Schizophyllum commune H4-8]
MARYRRVDQELARLQSLFERARDTVSAQGDLQPLLSRCEAIVARGIAFSLLDEDPELIPSDTLFEASRVRALRHSFEAYAQWIDLFCNERNLNLSKDPVHVNRVFSWVEVLHPMHRRLPASTPAEQDLVLTLNVAITKILSSLDKKTDLMPYLFSNPRTLFLAVDLWVHMPSYFSQSLADGTAPAVALMLSNTVKSMFKFSLANEAAIILFAELLRTVPDSRGLYRCLVGHMKFLALMRRGDARRQAWETHFLLVGTTKNLIGRFRPFRPLPRGMYRRIIEAATLCLHEGYTSAVRDAIMALRMLFLGAASCPRGYVCAIEVDVLGFMARAHAAGIRGGGGAPEDDSDIILLHMRASLVFPSVLRALHRKHGAELGDAGNRKSPIEREFPGLVQFFRRRWDECTDEVAKERFNSFLQCSNSLADSHEHALRYCPCGEAFYCSVECQRQHWRAVHSKTCRSNDGVWGIGDTITLSDMRDIVRMIHSIIVAQRDCIVEGVISAAQRIINPPTKEEFWQEITESWKAGRGTPDPLLAPDMPLEVYIAFDLFSPPTQGRGDFDFRFLLRETHEEVDPDKFVVDVRFELKAEMIIRTLPVVYYVQQLQSME